MHILLTLTLSFSGSLCLYKKDVTAGKQDHPVRDTCKTGAFPFQTKPADCLYLIPQLTFYCLFKHPKCLQSIICSAIARIRVYFLTDTMHSITSSVTVCHCLSLSSSACYHRFVKDKFLLLLSTNLARAYRRVRIRRDRRA